MRNIHLAPGKSLFFASDFHLGYHASHQSSSDRERKILRWLDSIAPEAGHIFLQGDIFDFWFEYGYVVPKGFTRFQGKIAELTDAGIQVSFFTGNHDLWMFRYFSQELGVDVLHRPETFRCGAHDFLIGHGDGLGPGDYFYKALKNGFFEVKLFQWMFDKLPAFMGVGFAHRWSNHSKGKGVQHQFLGDKEWIWSYCKEQHQKRPHHFYIFGHRHFPMDLPVEGVFQGRYINLGEWINFCTYAQYDGTHLYKHSFEDSYPQSWFQPD
jgi:UDP-2,3-diacylglucosamine hydrolase